MRDTAIEEIEQVICELDHLTEAARLVKAGLQAQSIDLNKIKEGLRTLDYHTEGRNGRLQVRRELDTLYDLIEEIEQPEEEESDRPEDAHLEMEYEARTNTDCVL